MPGLKPRALDNGGILCQGIQDSDAPTSSRRCLDRFHLCLPPPLSFAEKYQAPFQFCWGEETQNFMLLGGSIGKLTVFKNPLTSSGIQIMFPLFQKIPEDLECWAK